MKLNLRRVFFCIFHYAEVGDNERVNAAFLSFFKEGRQEGKLTVPRQSVDGLVHPDASFVAVVAGFF